MTVEEALTLPAIADDGAVEVVTRWSPAGTVEGPGPAFVAVRIDDDLGAAFSVYPYTAGLRPSESATALRPDSVLRVVGVDPDSGMTVLVCVRALRDEVARRWTFVTRMALSLAERPEDVVELSCSEQMTLSPGDTFYVGNFGGGPIPYGAYIGGLTIYSASALRQRGVG